MGNRGVTGETAGGGGPRPAGLGCWWTYQRERFPVLAHGPLIAAFSASAVCYSALVRGADRVTAASLAVAFGTAFLFFLQLRIADEFKDFEEDARFRPYRPVPRGLVTLRELGVLGAVAAGLQIGLAIGLDARLLPLLLATLGYLALMSVEFFAGRWLRARPFLYMASHMAIMPLIDFYATACDWLPAGAGVLPGLAWFLLISYFNGMVIEIGRKIRAPADEERGVETYSVVWGRRGAVTAWLAAMTVCATFALAAAREIRFVLPVACVLAALLGAAAIVAVAYLRAPDPGTGRRFEILSGVWTLAKYLCVGVVPLLVHRWTAA
jgi:4-hydroxybenzoate polyprenyltransferase